MSSDSSDVSAPDWMAEHRVKTVSRWLSCSCGSVSGFASVVLMLSSRPRFLRPVAVLKLRSHKSQQASAT